MKNWKGQGNEFTIEMLEEIKKHERLKFSEIWEDIPKELKEMLEEIKKDKYVFNSCTHDGIYKVGEKYYPVFYYPSFGGFYGCDPIMNNKNEMIEYVIYVLKCSF